MLSRGLPTAGEPGQDQYRGQQMRRERLPQQPERTRHLGLDGLHREVERVGNFLVGEAFLPAHRVDQAAAGREALDRTLHRVEQLIMLELRRWRRLTGFGIGLVVYPALLDPLAAYPVDRRVVRRPKEIGPGGSGLIDDGVALPHPQKEILNQLLGPCGGAEDPSRDAAQSRVVGAEQRVKGTLAIQQEAPADAGAATSNALTGASQEVQSGACPAGATYSVAEFQRQRVADTRDGVEAVLKVKDLGARTRDSAVGVPARGVRLAGTIAAGARWAVMARDGLCADAMGRKR